MRGKNPRYGFCRSDHGIEGRLNTNLEGPFKIQHEHRDRPEANRDYVVTEEIHSSSSGGGLWDAAQKKLTIVVTVEVELEPVASLVARVIKDPDERRELGVGGLIQHSIKPNDLGLQVSEGLNQPSPLSSDAVLFENKKRGIKRHRQLLILEAFD